VNMDKELAGRAAIVTGAGGGIGAAIAVALASAGASVLVADVDAAGASATVTTIEKAGGRALAVKTDVTESAQVRSMALAAVERLGSADILVNNAGIATADLVESLDEDAWRRVLDVNLTGPFLCCRAVVPRMLEKDYGRIVNVASIAGKEGNPNAVAYSASKAGVIALTKSLGKELASYDIAVNCITPAAAKTAIFDQMTQAHIDYMLSKIPRARFVKVEEIAALAAWCASQDNSFTTGAVFDISGGRATY
jgi:2-dehydro-3-deoxy-L-rhamnonate dehydrogenase (NAD+)